MWNAIEMGLIHKWIDTDVYNIRKARQDLKQDGDGSSNFNDADGPQKLKVQQFVGGIVILIIGSGAGFVGAEMAEGTVKKVTKNHEGAQNLNSAEFMPDPKKNFPTNERAK
ncbi:hypothetical protein Fcan01_10836 [Folsomia candida]|uniref:Uncharacterized protein n=1 Tax=Folsomia candida TaxID=158441 RepID=A0A226EA80_FOLCA|nr:hypothetical protein Fcan01_10836 [Folsomia candida]